MVALGQFTIVDLNDITVSDTPPENPALHTLWLDSSNRELKEWDGETWKAAMKYTDDSGLADFLEKQYKPDQEALEKRIDAKAEIWFASGIPTLENEPVQNWDISDYENHVGDMYYDRDTGYGYRFKLEAGIYSWEQVQDKDTVAALAIANAAKDTADGKRRVFMDTPAPPYDNGDLWFRKKEIYICQISKAEEENYLEGDFVVATVYTDDTYAKQVGDELEIIRGTVTTIRENADSFQIEIEQKVASVDSRQQETIEELQKTAYRFGTEDLTIEKSNSSTKTKINENGMRVYENDEEMLKADKNGVDARNLHATTWLIVGENSRFEDYTNADGEARTACFWIGETGGAD